MATPMEWGLKDVERVDVNQADIAPLMVVVLPPEIISSKQNSLSDLLIFV